jgi:hypothetical protein
MAKPILGGRKVYQNSGQVNWVRFIPWAALVFVAAIALAAILYLLFKIGFYLVLLVPVFAGLGLAGVVILAVRKGHCRSRLAAALLGGVAGVVLYLGYFYIGMVEDLGPDRTADFKLLPSYINYRMKTTVIRDVNSPDRDRRDDGPSPERVYFNWVFFVLEFGFIVGAAAVGGGRWARRPYCERCQTWMKRESTTFKPEIGPGLIEALRIGSVQSLAALFTSPQKPGAPHTAVAVDCCPKFKEDPSLNCPLYFSMKQVTAPAKGVTMDAFDQSKGKILLRQILVNSDEVTGLLPRFSSLEKIAGTTAAQAMADLQVAVASSAPDRVVAEVKPVDPLYAGKVLTKKNILLGAAIQFLTLAVIFAGMGLAIGGIFLAFPDSPLPGGVSIIVRVLGIAMIAIGGVAAVGAIVLGLTRVDYLAMRFLRRVTLREFARRPGHLVNPADAAALFVQVIPRAHWGKMKLEDASDIGFLRVNSERGELLFEGDKEYYRIPGAAISCCEVETFIAGAGTEGSMTLFRVVVQTNVSSGPLEIPFAQRGNSGKFRSKNRKLWAVALQQQILTIVPQAS